MYGYIEYHRIWKLRHGYICLGTEESKLSVGLLSAVDLKLWKYLFLNLLRSFALPPFVAWVNFSSPP